MKLPSPLDLLRIGAAPLEAVAALPESLAMLNRSLSSFATTVARLDSLVQRLDRLTEPLEAPLTALAPRLEALVSLLDEELLANLPVVLDAVSRNAVPALEVIGQTQAQVASIAASVDRLMGAIDDTLVRLQDLPGAGLVSRLRGRPGGPLSAAPGATEPRSLNSDTIERPAPRGGAHDQDRRPPG